MYQYICLYVCMYIYKKSAVIETNPQLAESCSADRSSVYVRTSTKMAGIASIEDAEAICCPLTGRPQKSKMSATKSSQGIRKKSSNRCECGCTPTLVLANSHVHNTSGRDIGSSTLLSGPALRERPGECGRSLADCSARQAQQTLACHRANTRHPVLTAAELWAQRPRVVSPSSVTAVRRRGTN